MMAWWSIQADVQKGSFLAMFDAKDGREVWRVSRSDVPTWSTPTIHRVNGATQILVNGMRHVGAYDFKTGKEIWKLSGGGDIPVPTPVVSDGLVYITNAHGGRRRSTPSATPPAATSASSRRRPATRRWRGACRAAAATCARRWSTRASPTSSTYNGILSVFDAKTGEKKYQQRLAGATSAFTASPVANDGKVYAASEDGQVFVLKAGPVYEQLAMNEMSTPVLATPAISEGRLLLRTQDQIVAIGKK